MLKTYIYTGEEPTRVKVKDKQAKVSVQPMETVDSEYNLARYSYFTEVWADSIERLSGKISDMETKRKQLKSDEKFEKENAKSMYEEMLKDITKSYKEKADAISKQVKILEVQEKAAFDWIDAKISKLEKQRASAEAEIKEIRKMKAKK